MSLLDREPFASFFGRGKASITVPVLDGAFRPNDVLDTAEVVIDLPDCDMVVVENGQIYASAGNQIFEIIGNNAKSVAVFDAPISAFAVRDGQIAVGFQSGGLRLSGPAGAERPWQSACGTAISCPTALMFSGNRLIVAEGSAQTKPADWSRDLLERNHSGRVIALDLQGDRQELLAQGLSYANGLAENSAGQIVVSQSWSHCLTTLGATDPKQAVLSGLAGYPSRISAAPDGGFWLSIFGMRTQLIEFVLREHAYRKRMMATIDPQYWIAPSLVSRENFLDPLQQGGAKQLGIKKPWAPPRSYGLVVKLDRNFQPDFSFHSRVGGLHHGITSAAELGGALYVVSKGAGKILRLNVADATKGLAQ